jgi:DNA-binding NarL/FixJ family response regulator
VAKRFLIVDDHPLFLEALQLVIRDAHPGAAVVGANSIAAAKAELSGHPSFDLILLDLSMPDIRGFDGLLELRKLRPKIPIVVVSALEDHNIIHEAMTFGASGFIPKSSKKVELAEAIAKVLSGDITLPKDYRSVRAATPSPGSEFADQISTLTAQQLRVLLMLRQGKLNKQIAYELDVGETTVKAHVSEILRKLNVVSRTQAVIETSKIDFDSILARAQQSKPQRH